MITGAASRSEIALSVGFSDQAHLCRLFRQAFGQSPANWPTGARNPWREAASKRHGREHPMSDQRGKVLSFAPSNFRSEQASDKWRKGHTARRARHGSPHRCGVSKPTRSSAGRTLIERVGRREEPNKSAWRVPHLGATEGARSRVTPAGGISRTCPGGVQPSSCRLRRFPHRRRGIQAIAEGPDCRRA